MKKNRSVDRAGDATRLMSGPIASAAKEKGTPFESNLSPGRIADGASINTALLSQIMAQREALHQLRDWGINE